MKKALIIGGGFAGCAAAHQLELLGGWEVTIIEKAPFLGAGVRTSWYGGHPYTFGPRHFLTPYREVYEYLNNIIPLRKCAEHEFLTYVESDDDFYAYPINMTDVRNMPDYNVIENEMDEIRWTQDRYIEAMVQETNMSKSHLKKILNRKVNAYFTAEEAVELGIADIIF